MNLRKPIPPQAAKALLSWFLKDDLMEEVLGDLEEKYLSLADAGSTKRAYFNYWFQVFNYLRPFALRKPTGELANHIDLLRFNITFAIRSMGRQKFFTSINIIGLVAGITSCLCITLYVLDELSFDQHWSHKDRIYRAFVNIDHGDTHLKYGFATAPMADIFEEEFPEVELAARWSYTSPVTFKLEDKLIRETKIILADQEIFPMFELNAVHGHTAQALTKPNTLVMTRSAALKYFGEINPVGRTLTTSDGKFFEVTCVIEDFPRNSHFKPEVIATTVNDQWSDPTKVTRLAYWTISAYRTYVKLVPGTDPKALEARFHSIYEKYLDPAMRDWSGQSWQEFIDGGNRYFYSLQPLTDIYLHSDFSADDAKAMKGDVKYVYMFSTIGLFILIIAGINFINLTTARAHERMKEIGLKKIMGSSRSQLILQFLMESVLIAILSLVIASSLIYLLLPQFNMIADRQIENPLFNYHQLWIFALGGALALAILAGLYPAVILSSYKSTAFQRSTKPVAGPINLRSVLVVVQFAISSFLILGTIVVYEQLQFTQTKDLGFNINNLLVINNAQDLGDHIKAYRETASMHPDVSRVSSMSQVPSDLTFPGTFFSEAIASKQKEKVNGSRMWVDQQSLATLGINLLQGRNFHINTRADSLSVLLNEAAVRTLGFTDPIGKKITCSDGKNEVYTVVGVVNDFHLRSLRHQIIPTALHLTKTPQRLVIRYTDGDLLSLMTYLEKHWKRFAPDRVMHYELVTDRYDRLYTSERRMATIFKIFVVLAIVIATLGLLGLSVVMTSKRKKEIGVRKVLGASAKQLIIMLNTGLTKPVIMALFIGLPAGWLLMDRWLADFAYRVNIQWGVPLVAAFSCLSITWLVVSLLTYRAARANPTDNLRYE